MKKASTVKKKKRTTEEGPERGPHHIRLPGFLIKEEIGLGDAVKRVTYDHGNEGLWRLRETRFRAQPLGGFFPVIVQMARTFTKEGS